MKFRKLLGNPTFLFGVLTLIVLFVSANSYFFEPKTFEPGGLEYTRYNNYVIFKQSFVHLIEGKDLYQLFPLDHWDLYKYSPTFALLMAPFAQLPDALGLFCWNLLNTLILFFALWRLPAAAPNTRYWMLGLVLIELVTSLQNSQSNGLMAGLLIFALVLMEQKNPALAALLIVLSVFIKLFGLVALTLFLFYPERWKAMLYAVAWAVLLAFLPLMVVSFTHLELLYESWFSLLRNDHSASIGLSVAGWLYSWFGIAESNLIVLLGALLLCLPLLRMQYFTSYRYRSFFLSSILIWVVIFNHKAESPTFVIAVSGVAIWFMSQRLSRLNLALLGLTVVFTVLSPTDLFPRSLQNSFVQPYVLKALPCILIWVKISADLLLFKPKDDDIQGLQV
jgi:Glycosyltransferase family 87